MDSTVASLNRVLISRSALENNFLLCRKVAGDALLMPMIKANGYGHGMCECARVFAAAGARCFGVAEVAEAVALRQAGFEQKILVFAGMLPDFYSAILEFDLTPVFVDGSQLDSFARYAAAEDRVVAVHLKMDVGMGRQGFPPCDLPKIVSLVDRFDSLELQGIMAHFPMADDKDNSINRTIITRFTEAVAPFENRNIYLHLSNSCALFYFSEARFNMVRPGIALYGYGVDLSESQYKLLPAMSFVSRVIQVREVEKGKKLGYGHSFVTKRKTRLALIPVGYEDGYLRKLSNKGFVLLKGKRAPVVGRVSMNLIIVDVTDILGVRLGDEAVLMGRQGEEKIDADEIAGWLGTISYEVLCLFGHCNSKEYID